MTDDQTPASKADLKHLETQFRVELSCMETSMHRKMDSLHETIDRVLDVLVNVDRRLTLAVGDHERRICRLEHRLGVTTA